MKRNHSKLSLRKTTVRALTPGELGGAAGGTTISPTLTPSIIAPTAMSVFLACTFTFTNKK
jgi:hypothetical protein